MAFADKWLHAYPDDAIIGLDTLATAYIGSPHDKAWNKEIAERGGRMRGSLCIPKGMVAALPALTHIDGALFCDGELHAPNLSRIGEDVWIGHRAVIDVPVDALVEVGGRGQIEFGVIG